MNRKALLLYLRDLRDLEFARRKIAAIYEKEEYKTKRTLEQLGTANIRGGEKTDVGSLIKVLIAAGVLGVGAYFFQWCGRIDDNFFLNMMAKLLWGICIFSVAIGIIAFIKDVSATSAIKNSNNAERRRVNNNQGTIQNIQKNWKLRQVYLQKEYDKVLKLQKEYYNMNILAMQYRNLPALIYIYQYMSTSKASLEVVLLHTHMEDGIRRIESKLNEIIAQNEQIIFAQHIAESQNEKIIAQNENMLTSLSEIEKNTGDAAYYSRMAENYGRTVAYFETARYLEGR